MRRRCRDEDIHHPLRARPIAGRRAARRRRREPERPRPIVTLEVETDDGVEGVGATYFGGALTGTLKRAVEELGALCVGEDPVRVEAIAAKLRDGGGLGRAGRHLQPGALGDRHRAVGIRAKAMNLPLWKLLGGARERVPTYASGALMRGLTLDRRASRPPRP